MLAQRDRRLRHRTKAWGVLMDLQRRTVSEPAHSMPEQLNSLAERMRTLQPLRAFHPNEANAIDYRPQEGMHLGPHVDDRCGFPARPPRRRECCGGVIGL